MPLIPHNSHVPEKRHEKRIFKIKLYFSKYLESFLFKRIPQGILPPNEESYCNANDRLLIYLFSKFK